MANLNAVINEVSAIIFDPTRVKYNCPAPMRDILTYHKMNPGRSISFNELKKAMNMWPENTLRRANADLRRMGYRQYTSKEKDLRFQFSHITI